MITIRTGLTAGAAPERLPLDTWAFHLDDLTTAGAQRLDFDQADWREVSVPHDWSIEGERRADAPSAGGGGFFPTGVGWYRHRFAAPQHWQDQRVFVDFEGVYGLNEVWINGVPLGAHAYGYTPFSFDLTPHLRVGDANVLAVRVDNSAQPNSRFYSGSGLIRPARLRVVAPVHVAPDSVYVTTREVSPELATLEVNAAVRNTTAQSEDVALDFTLFDPAGRAVGATRVTIAVAPGGDEVPVKRQLSVPRPQLWSPDSPRLYRLVARALLDERLIDAMEVNCGIRTVRFSADRGLELNGTPVELLGGNVHHDTGPLGAAAFARAEERKVELLKAAGYNAVRTAHNPPSTALLDACDRHGLLVIDEAFDGWAKAKLPQDYSRHFADNWAQDLTAMVRRDRHHAAVILWSIGNEIYERGDASGLQRAKEMAALVRTLDPTRAVSIGLNGLGASGDWTRLDPLFAELDLAGYNYELGRHAEDHQRVPARVIWASESYPSEVFANWQICRDHDYVIGDFVWTALDYLGEAGIGRVFAPGEKVMPHWEGNHFPWHGAACGDIDLTGWRKPVSHYRQIVWDRGEKLYAAVRVPPPDPAGKGWNLTAWSVTPALPSWTWPGLEGRQMTLDVYSRHEHVRVSLNDRLIGEKPTAEAQEFKAAFEIPYAPGVLRVEGIDGGKVVGKFVLSTAGPPARLALEADRLTLRADGQDLACVAVEIGDAEGQRRFDAQPKVRYTLTGPGTIAAIGSGDLATTESYQANPRRAYQGRAIVVVRTQPQQPGAITLRAEADGLAPGSVTMHAH